MHKHAGEEYNENEKTQELSHCVLRYSLIPKLHAGGLGMWVVQLLQ